MKTLYLVLFFAFMVISSKTFFDYIQKKHSPEELSKSPPPPPDTRDKIPQQKQEHMNLKEVGKENQSQNSPQNHKNSKSINEKTAEEKLQHIINGLPKDHQALARSNKFFLKTAPLFSQVVDENNPIISIDEHFWEGVPKDMIKEGFTKLLSLESTKESPLQYGNILMSMASVEGMEDEVRKLATDILDNDEHLEPDFTKMTSQEEINAALSFNEGVQKSIMAYEALLSTHKGQDSSKMLNFTIDYLSKQTHSEIRREVASSFVNRYPAHFSELMESLKENKIKVNGVREVVIPQSEEDMKKNEGKIITHYTPDLGEEKDEEVVPPSGGDQK